VEVTWFEPSKNSRLKENEKRKELQAAMADSSISVEEVKQRLDEFQQTLFAIGAAVIYNKLHPVQIQKNLYRPLMRRYASFQNLAHRC
jgi:hypothetical protein